MQSDRAARLAELELIALCKQRQAAKRQSGKLKKCRRMTPDFYSHYLRPVQSPRQQHHVRRRGEGGKVEMSPSCLHRLNLCEVFSGCEMVMGVDFTGLAELRMTEDRPRTGEADLGAADDFRRLALAERHCGRSFSKCSSKRSAQKGTQP